MKFFKVLFITALISFVGCDDNVDISSAFMEVANTFFSNDSPGHNKFQDGDSDEKVTCKLLYLI